MATSMRRGIRLQSLASTLQCSCRALVRRVRVAVVLGAQGGRALRRTLGAVDPGARLAVAREPEGALVVDWQIFLLGMVAVSIVATAVRAIAREDLEERNAAAKAVATSSVTATAPSEQQRRA